MSAVEALKSYVHTQNELDEVSGASSAGAYFPIEYIKDLVEEIEELEERCGELDVDAAFYNPEEFKGKYISGFFINEGT